MPKTKRKFDWEIYNKEGEFIDILTLSRDEAKIYKNKFPDYVLKAISYNDHDNRDDTW